VYSFVLGRYSDIQQNLDTDGSLLIIGGYDEDLVDGEINWIKCSGDRHPQIPMDGIILNGQTLKRDDNLPFQAYIDVIPIQTLLMQTGTGGALIGPSAIVEAFYNLIPGSSPAAGAGPGRYTFPCDAPLNLSFQFGGQNYVMEPQDFIIAAVDGTCLGAFVGLDTPDDEITDLAFIMGALFLKNVVTIIDLGAAAVGLGRINNTNKRYGDYTVVQLEEMTAKGTGPYATLSPTLTIASGILSLRARLM